MDGDEERELPDDEDDFGAEKTEREEGAE